MAKQITVEKLERPLYCGDWHDKPLKWSVQGPANANWPEGFEVQNFTTKKDASSYARCRMATDSMEEASKLWFKRNPL